MVFLLLVQLIPGWSYEYYIVVNALIAVGCLSGLYIFRHHLNATVLLELSIVAVVFGLGFTLHLDRGEW